MMRPQFLVALTMMLAAWLGAAAPAMARKAHSPSELNANQEAYDKKRVVVRGYLAHAEQGYFLYDTKRRYREAEYNYNNNLLSKRSIRYCIAIINPEVLSYFVMENGVWYGETTKPGKVKLMGAFFVHYFDSDKVNLGACDTRTGFLISNIL
jgi:hypothetical protein